MTPTIKVDSNDKGNKGNTSDRSFQLGISKYYGKFSKPKY